ncbi:helix-turn-helix transcriptional regulator [Nonomuraea sp. SYSU D8015]|uniref:helix-turn-helix transcriptional regulator n=1 Tax=Nonomuraea sp. SYSU D8015 TaxID=2593644 RepID=UPI00166088EA|nr:WYL domain-containing protein [Nonomuraea sp. SYSU D8015]
MIDFASAGGDPAGRTLRLLELLAARPSWPASELAERLAVSTRTVRRDVARLQGLGYAVESRPGPGGHYALRPGVRMPPLTFQDDEVVALVVALRMVEGVLSGDAAHRALTKLSQVLPRRLSAVLDRAAAGSENADGARGEVDPTTLAVLLRAAGEDLVLRFAYRDRHGTVTRRRVETVRCLYARGHWYALAHDLDAGDWRVFRIDRMHEPALGGRGSGERQPAEDLATWLATDFGRHPDT